MGLNLIMGKNCIREVVTHRPELLVEVYCAHPEHDELVAILKSKQIHVTPRTKRALNQLVASESHQGYVARVHPLKDVDIRAFLKQPRDKSLVLMLDSICDPQNLGAIYRAAECFGVDLILFSKNRGCDLTPTVAKTSVGASLLVPTARVSNLAETMKMFQHADYWSVAADVGDASQEIYSLDFPKKCLLIMGAESTGVQQLLLKKCDFHVHIPMFGHIDSLNVSQASAVMLASYRHAMR